METLPALSGLVSEGNGAMGGITLAWGVSLPFQPPDHVQRNLTELEGLKRTPWEEKKERNYSMHATALVLSVFSKKDVFKGEGCLR